MAAALAQLKGDVPNAKHAPRAAVGDVAKLAEAQRVYKEATSTGPLHVLVRRRPSGRFFISSGSSPPILFIAIFDEELEAT